MLNRDMRYLILILFLMSVITGCVTPAKKEAVPSTPAVVASHKKFDSFIIVKPQPEDSFASLAGRYLNDSSRGWLIAEFNQVGTPREKEHLIIPLKPFNLGGLSPDGFQTVPVLVYHRFSKSRKGKMIVSEADFRAQMAYLHDNRYHVIPLEQLVDFIDFKTPLPEKSVVLTFDDGWLSFYDIALPILKEYGYPATLFVYTDFIGAGKAMSWEQLDSLEKQNIDIQCHTKSHRNLAVLKKKERFDAYFEDVKNEILASTQMIREKLGKECRILAYPYGATNHLVIEMLKKHGYLAAFTVDRGSNPFFVDNHMIHRSAIYGEYDLERFAQNLDVFRKKDLR